MEYCRGSRPAKTRFVHVTQPTLSAGVAELEKTWNRVNEETAAVEVDLCAVDFISQVGEDLLRKMDRKGAKLVPGNQLTRALSCKLTIR